MQNRVGTKIKKKHLLTFGVIAGKASRGVSIPSTALARAGNKIVYAPFACCKRIEFALDERAVDDYDCQMIFRTISLL